MAKILVCDDSKFSQQLISDILQEEGHEIVAVASDGIQAYDKFVKFKPDIITMDILMEPDGHEAVKRIVQKDPSAKIIIITSVVDEDGEVSPTVRLGGKGFVPKPIERERLLAEVNKVLSTQY